ncbi:MAG: TonB-dependent receptor, partial [Candidatus Solibacter sp.]|nr:TonB-dependent receptor [Candidatus Solibacter sp.]
VFRGNHSLKFGADMRWQQTNGADSAGQQGLFSFNSNETAFPSASGAANRANSGNAFASFLLGAVDNANYNGLFVVPGIRYEYKAIFAQDDWKVSRKLTLNLGMRWDLFTPRREHNTNISGFDPALPNPGAGNLLGAVRFLGEGPGRDNTRKSFADTYYKAFGPRIGFAYQLAANTVLRGGYGVSYGQGNANAGLRDSQKFIYGFNAAPSYASTDAGVTPAFNWDSGFPTTWPKPPFINPTVQNGSAVTMIGKDDGRPPYFQNFQLSVQQALPGQLFVEAAYVGVKGTRLGNGLMNINQVDPKYLSLGSVLTQSVTSAAAVAAGIKVPYAGFTGSVAQSLRPYPQYQAITNNSNPNGNSTYHALQTKFTKRLSHGLSLQGAYTWAKSITDGNIAAGGGPSGQDFYNRKIEKTISSNDVPHVFVVAYTYELPFGKGQKLMNNNSIMAHVVGGWQFTRRASPSRSPPTTRCPSLTACCDRTSTPASRCCRITRIRWATPGSTRRPSPLRQLTALARRRALTPGCARPTSPTNRSVSCAASRPAKRSPSRCAASSSTSSTGPSSAPRWPTGPPPTSAASPAKRTRPGRG